MSRRGFFRDHVAWRVCWLIGHEPESYQSGWYWHRASGRNRERWSTRCTRCGIEGYEAWTPGLPGRLIRWWRDALNPLRHWIRTDCGACRKPLTRFGRPVGDHAECDDIPF